MDTSDLNQITNLTNSQKANTQTFLAGQNAQTSDYLKRYSEFINSQEGVSAMAKRIGEELGIPTLQANATMLRNTLTNLPSTYSKATTGYDVNANQLERIIGQKSSELSPVVTTAENSLTNAQNSLNTRLGYEQADQTRLEKPYTLEGSLLSDRLARETTLYTQDNQNELNALISKLQMGVTLSEGEKNRAQQLAIQESNYNLEKAKLDASNTQIIEVGGRKKLINSTTGQVIADLGSTSSGTGTSSLLDYLSGNSSNTNTNTNNIDLSSFYTEESPTNTAYEAANKKLLQMAGSGGLTGVDWSKIDLSKINGLNGNVK